MKYKNVEDYLEKKAGYVKGDTVVFNDKDIYETRPWEDHVKSPLTGYADPISAVPIAVGTGISLAGMSNAKKLGRLAGKDASAFWGIGPALTEAEAAELAKRSKMVKRYGVAGLGAAALANAGYIAHLHRRGKEMAKANNVDWGAGDTAMNALFTPFSTTESRVKSKLRDKKFRENNK